MIKMIVRNLPSEFPVVLVKKPTVEGAAEGIGVLLTTMTDNVKP
jgi:hypothetical protein